MWFLHIAQLSTTISASRIKLRNNNNHEKGIKKKRDRLRYVPQAQRATAFHFLISKRLGFLVEEEVDAVEEEGPAPAEPSPAGTMVTSVSREAMVIQL